ncbi:MAG: hypothetical protein R2941_12150 [Desulfobacterales bacterium]
MKSDMADLQGLSAIFANHDAHVHIPSAVLRQIGYMEVDIYLPNPVLPAYPSGLYEKKS